MLLSGIRRARSFSPVSNMVLPPAAGCPTLHVRAASNNDRRQDGGRGGRTESGAAGSVGMTTASVCEGALRRRRTVLLPVQLPKPPVNDEPVRQPQHDRQEPDLAQVDQARGVGDDDGHGPGRWCRRRSTPSFPVRGFAYRRPVSVAELGLQARSAHACIAQGERSSSRPLVAERRPDPMLDDGAESRSVPGRVPSGFQPQIVSQLDGGLHRIPALMTRRSMPVPDRQPTRWWSSSGSHFTTSSMMGAHVPRRGSEHEHTGTSRADAAAPAGVGGASPAATVATARPPRADMGLEGVLFDFIELPTRSHRGSPADRPRGRIAQSVRFLRPW